MDESQERFRIRHTEKGSIVLTFTERILKADAVTEALAVINAAENWRVILDCQSGRFLLAGRFDNIIRLRRLSTEKGGRLILCNVAPDFAEVLHITRLDQFIEIQQDLDMAIACMDELP